MEILINGYAVELVEVLPHRGKPGGWVWEVSRHSPLYELNEGSVFETETAALQDAIDTVSWFESKAYQTEQAEEAESLRKYGSYEQQVYNTWREGAL